MRRGICSFLLLPLLLSLACGSVAAATPSGYEGMPVWVKAGEQETPDGDWVLSDEQSDSMQWGPSNPVVGTAYGSGDISANATGTAKGRSTVYYHDPFGGGELSMGADVETWQQFVLTSATLSPGTQVTISMDVSAYGTLQVDEQTAGKTSEAYGSFSLRLYDNDAPPLIDLHGSASVSGFFGSRAGEPKDAWVGYYTPNPTGAVVDYSKTVSFTASVGSTYWVYNELSTNAKSSAGVTGAGWDANKTFAQSNFADTVSYQLRSDADVGFQVVPEPGSLMALGAGLMSLGAMLRRRRA